MRTLNLALILGAALLLAACGGGDDSATTGTPPAAGGGGGGGVVAAPLTITAAMPATRNGTLDKAAAQFEHGSSNDTMGSFASTADHCRVGAFALRNSGDGTLYFIEISFRKDTQAIGLVKFGTDSNLATLARAAGPLAAVTVDTANRRLAFSGLVLSASGVSVTLNGTLEYPTNIAPENRAACG